MKKVFAIFMACLLFAVSGLFAGCGNEKPQGEKEIVLAAARDLVQGPKDPYFATIILKTWEPLIAVSDEGAVKPVLAEQWESNEERTEWIFHLKQGVTFQDGLPFDAAAAVKNFHRFQHMGYRPSSFYGFLIDRVYPGLMEATAPDTYTLRLSFKKPVPMLIYRMAGWGSAMFSPACFDENTGDWTGIMRGTGPFMVEEYHPDSYSIIKRFDGYYGEKAHAEKIRIRTITSVDARYSAMKSGEIDGVLDLGGLSPIMVEELSRDGRFESNAAHSTISHYLTLNGSRFPFNDVRMRKAINLAVNRDAIVTHYFRGYGTPTMSFLNSTNPFAHVVKPVYDPEQAKALADEVLLGKRQRIKFLLPQYGMARYPYKVISEFIQAELRPLGLDADIVMVDGMTSRKLMASGDYDMVIGTRGLANLDPTSLLYEFFDSEGATNKANHMGYKNETIDACFDRLGHTYDIDGRRKIYDEILSELQADPPVVPLMEDQNIAVYVKELSGYKAAVYGVTLDKVGWKEAP